MTRRIFPIVGFTLIIAVVIWGALTDVSQQKTDQTIKKKKSERLVPTDCEGVCKKLNECFILDSEPDCLLNCSNSFSEEYRLCVMETSCEFIEDDCPAPPVNDCLKVCEKLTDCGLSEQDICLQDCLEYEKETLDCISANVCEDISQECFVVSKEKNCSLYCDRLTQCDFFDEGGYLDCMELCIDEDENRIECVLQTPCSSIESWCFGTYSAPQCGAYCDKLVLCSELDVEFFEDCMEGCVYETENLIDCVLESECEMTQACYEADQLDVDCTQFCDLMIDCGQWEEETFEECMVECQWEVPERIACILEGGCDVIDLCFVEENPGCLPFCEKLIECGEIGTSDYDTCLEGCREESPELVDCVLEVMCDELSFCFEEELVVSSCDIFCEKMETCGRIHPEEFEDCLGICDEDSIQVIECVNEMPCNRIDECF